MNAVTVAGESLPCGKCSTPTKVRIDGKPGHYKCLAVEPAPAPEPVDLPAKLRFLADLEGAYAPKRKVGNRMRAPWWIPKLPEVTDLVQTSGWSWQTDRMGPVAVLDRSGAWIAATSSVTVAHGGLEHTGALGYAGAPGFYKMPVHPWREELPHPMGAVVEGLEHLWVPHTRVGLLAQLAEEGRWPDAVCLDSYTSAEPVRLNKWATHVNTVRCAAISKYGRDGAEYDAVKEAFAQAVTMMAGSRMAGQSRRWKCGVHRPDWSWAIEDLTSVTLWRWADDCTKIADYLDRPELLPVGMRAKDELLVHLEAVEVFTKTLRSGKRKPMILDETGMTLGSFKIKGVE